MLKAARAMLIALAIASCLTACSDGPKDRDRPRYLGLSAQGKATGPFDSSRFTVSVSKIEDTAEAALKATSTGMAAVFAKLKEAGVADKDMQTKSANVTRNNVCKPGALPGQPQICEQKGFKSQHQTTVLVRDAARLGVLMATAVAAGAEDVAGGEHFFADLEKMQALARANALEAVQAKAKIYADKFGLKLGPVIAISDDPLMLPGLHREATPDQAPDQAGQQPTELGAYVVSKPLYVTWELK
jgi:uncharacterized protein